MNCIQSNIPHVSNGEQITDLSARIEYIFSNPALTTDDVHRMCETGKSKKLAAICIPQWLVAYAKQQLLGTNVKVSTPIGLPDGASATAAKYAEVKEAVKNGADEVNIPLNMDLIKKGDYLAAKKDLEEAIMPAKGRTSVKAVVESGITSQQMMSVIDIVKTSGVSFLTLSTILAQNRHDPEQVGEVVKLCGNDVNLMLMGNIRDYDSANVLIKAGGYRIGTSSIEVLI